MDSKNVVIVWPGSVRTEREIGAFITIRAKTNGEREWQRERNERVQSMEKKKRKRDRQFRQTDREKREEMRACSLQRERERQIERR